jgi:hypothetical protein
MCKFTKVKQQASSGQARILTVYQGDISSVIMTTNTGKVDQDRIIGYKAANGWLISAPYAYLVNETQTKDILSASEFTQFLKFIF